MSHEFFVRVHVSKEDGIYICVDGRILSFSPMMIFYEKYKTILNPLCVIQRFTLMNGIDMKK